MGLIYIVLTLNCVCIAFPGYVIGAPCPKSFIGDGYCDHTCNNKGHDYDGGDCCPGTCLRKSHQYKCGEGGYHCLIPKIPAWFVYDTKLCYVWRPDGDGGQCGHGEPRRLCANVNSPTQYYRDDTDGRAGGCRMTWGIVSSNAIDDWFKNVQICYRWHPDGNGGQCGGGADRLLCAVVGKFTSEYRDDTDNRGGGCQMSWQIKLPDSHPGWARNIKLCYEWYPDGNRGQCDGPGSKLCANANNWTPYYRDDTDNRGGGCRMRWGLYI